MRGAVTAGMCVALERAGRCPRSTAPRLLVRRAGRRDAAAGQAELWGVTSGRRLPRVHRPRRARGGGRCSTSSTCSARCCGAAGRSPRPAWPRPQASHRGGDGRHRRAARPRGLRRSGRGARRGARQLHDPARRGRSDRVPRRAARGRRPARADPVPHRAARGATHVLVLRSGTRAGARSSAARWRSARSAARTRRSRRCSTAPRRLQRRRRGARGRATTRASIQVAPPAGARLVGRFSTDAPRIAHSLALGAARMARTLAGDPVPALRRVPLPAVSPPVAPAPVGAAVAAP